jgi:glycosyltransferase involved in cell wall biosynthesis
MPRLSAVIITRDEERDVARTVGALGFADEVLVVDSGSADGTVEVCRSLGARVLQHPFQGFGPQKRWAVEQAAHDWVLCVDADEVVTPELAAAIRALLAGGEPPCAAYRFRFLTMFMGRPLAHGPISRRLHVRLFDRRRARWTDVPVHEQVVTDGPVGELAGAVQHYTVRDLSESIGKMDAYSTLAAAELVRRGKRRGALGLVFTPPLQFLRHYLLLQNFRNGIPGLAWSFMNAMGSIMKYLKARELEAPRAPLPAAGAGPAPTGADGGNERSA